MPSSLSLTLAAIDSFWIFIAFVAVSVISNWIKKKGEQQQEDPWTSDDETPSRPTAEPRRTAPPAPQKITNWEEELRRVLEGNIPTTSSPPPPLPPPIVVVEQRPAPPPKSFELKSAPVLSRVRVEESSDEEMQGGRLATLSQSAAAHARASHLQVQLAQRFQQSGGSTARNTSTVPVAHRAAPTAEMAAIRQLFRQPSTVRQAVVASLILGPPKALEA
ncbi:MAG: hypothetical protein HZA89_06820 [Verrucomicrobia bacterium]|nr:hypothetical protein [Verrucomicrobiota bacterium]